MAGGVVCDVALLCNAGLWTAARLAPVWLLGGGTTRTTRDGANRILPSI